MWNISNRERFREQRIHQQRLSNVKPTIDNRPPRIHSHLGANTKKRLQERLRQDEIQKENQLLLHRLMNIDSGRTKSSLSTPHSNALPLKKIREIQKITEENYGMLNRIQSVKAHYSTSRFQKDYEYNSYLKTRISRKNPSTSFNNN